MPTKRTKNVRTKRKPGKVSKLRRWMTKNCGSRAVRILLLQENPHFTVKEMVVK